MRTWRSSTWPTARGKELIQESAAVLKAALAASPDNPRLVWVQGANQVVPKP